MPESFDLNNVPRATDAVPTIPTSSSEVAVRTMASDIDMMGKSGGMVGATAPQGTQVPVVLTPEPSLADQTPAPSHAKTIVITVIIITAMFGLFALGYFVVGK